MQNGLTEDRIIGLLLGTAIGDALGLPFEGLSREQIHRRASKLNRFELFGQKGFVSDDTQLTVILAESLLLGRGELGSTMQAFRHGLKLWFLGLPWGIGAATLKACLLLLLGVKQSGRPSAGNGAAMRAAPIGAYFAHNREERLLFGRELAKITHRDERAIEGALFVSELTATCLLSGKGKLHDELVQEALEVVENQELRTAIDQARQGIEVGTSGFILHSLATAVLHFVRSADKPLEAMQDCIRSGGDTDSNTAILGAWLGALNGEKALPQELSGKLQSGPFGREHLQKLGQALHQKTEPPKYSHLRATATNLALYPVIIAHGFRRMIPF